MPGAVTKPCRKCGTPNPMENIYCRKCGAVLSVSTGVIRAQRKPLVLRYAGMKWRFVPAGLFIMLGVAALGLGAAALLGVGPALSGGELGAGILNTILFIGLLFFIAFFIGGAVLSLISRRTAGPEAILASILAVMLLGVIGSALATDLLIAAAVALLPSAGAAWLGARVGALGVEAKRTE